MVYADLRLAQRVGAGDPAVVDQAGDVVATQEPVVDFGGTDIPANPGLDGAGGPQGRNMWSVFDYDVDVNTGRCPRARGR